MAIALTEADKESIRYHLGYHNTEPSAAINLGFPASNQQLFLVERAMERVHTAVAVQRIQRILTELECIEGQISEARKRFKAQQLGELKLRGSNNEINEAEMLRQEYVDWASQLASQLGVPLNAYAPRFRGMLSGPASSFQVKTSGV